LLLDNTSRQIVIYPEIEVEIREEPIREMNYHQHELVKSRSSHTS